MLLCGSTPVARTAAASSVAPGSSVRCWATSRQQHPDNSSHSSDQTSTSNLRRGFQPQSKPVSKNSTQQSSSSKHSSGSNASRAALESLGARVLGGGEESMETWRKLDAKVNTYPGQRQFKAVGTGGAAFRAAMVQAVSSIVDVHEECVADRPSSQGTYISVTIGPVWVKSPDEVVAIYAAMKQDVRLKWYM